MVILEIIKNIPVPNLARFGP